MTFGVHGHYINGSIVLHPVGMIYIYNGPIDIIPCTNWIIGRLSLPMKIIRKTAISTKAQIHNIAIRIVHFDNKIIYFC